MLIVLLHNHDNVFTFWIFIHQFVDLIEMSNAIQLIESNVKLIIIITILHFDNRYFSILNEFYLCISIRILPQYFRTLHHQTLLIASRIVYHHYVNVTIWQIQLTCKWPKLLYFYTLNSLFQKNLKEFISFVTTWMFLFRRSYVIVEFYYFVMKTTTSVFQLNRWTQPGTTTWLIHYFSSFHLLFSKMINYSL